MQRRVLPLVLLSVGIAAFYWLFLHREAREGAPGDHLIVRFEASGRVLLGSPPVLVATLPESRTADRGAWRDAFKAYRRAVIARFPLMTFEAAEYREGAVLTIVAPSETPWRKVEWLMFAAEARD